MDEFSLVALEHVFEISHGNKFDLNKMVPTIDTGVGCAFIGRSGERNGLAEIVDRVEGCEPFPPGLITVALGGSTLSSFVQYRPFYTAQNIDVLRPREAMSLDEKLYYCLCIEANRFRYSTYGREANRTLSTILVPDRLRVPCWVRGSVAEAIEEVCGELRALLPNT